MKSKSIAVLMVAALTVQPALTVLAAEPTGVALTVYNNDLGLVKDVRVVNVENGIHEIRFDDVAARIDPTSVHFRALDNPDDVVLREQNFQYDLADAERLLSRYLGRSVTAVMKEGGSQSGTLLSYDHANLVLQQSGDGVAVINRAEVKTVTLGELPGGLVVRPTLVWSLQSNRSGPERVETSYLTGGINWHAEYVAVVNPDDTKLDLTAWVSIDNQSGATYENAKLKLVAGDVHRVQPEYVPMNGRAGRLKDEMQAMAAPPQFTEEAFFEYHLYSLDQPATVRDRETKQLSLFPTAAASALKKMTFDGARRAKDVVVSLEVANSKANALGMPLPKGIVRVYKQGRDGAQEFVGEDRIDHTASDEKMRLTLGNAFDVVGERIVTAHDRIDDRTNRQSIKVELRNHKTEAVDVSVIEHMPGDWTVTEKSHDYKAVDAHTIEFPVRVPAGGTVVVTYTVRFRY
jgi:hypothetical protein